MSRRTLIVLACIVACATAVTTEQRITRLDGSTIDAREIDRAVQRLMHAARVPGLGIAVLNNRKVVYRKAYGERDAERRLALTPQSVMTSASYTKSTFAYAAMQLVEDDVTTIPEVVKTLFAS